MAQNFPDSPQVIFDTIMADDVITERLGDYIFGGSSSPVPACSIVTPGKDLPNVKSVTGLEIIIHDVADIRRKDYLTDSSDLYVDWSVFVICWEPSTGDDVTAAVKRMMEIFSGATSFQTVATPDGLGAAVQTQVVIPSYRPILA